MIEHELPTVRIQKIVLENFKSVDYGEIEMACGRHFVPCDTNADILGIYGQNGSGKTSLLEALSILKFLMSGESVLDEYADCIKQGEDFARMEYHFDFQYDSGLIRKVIYEVAFSKVDAEEDEDILDEYSDDYPRKKYGQKHVIKICHEVLKVSGDFDGRKIKLQKVIDTQSGEPFGPALKRKMFYDGSANSMRLIANKAIAWNLSKSFVFMDETTDIFEEKTTEYANIVCDLKLFAKAYLYVVDTKASGVISLNRMIPIFFRLLNDEGINRTGTIPLSLDKPNRLPEEIYSIVEKVLNNISVVLCTFIPGLTLGLKDLGPVLSKRGKPLRMAEIIAIRDGVELPLRYESDGVKKIISTLELYKNAFNDRSMTVAIDEFDAGIFEYLLGEMLSIFEDYGKGQFIFTSHNLRPLEVIDKNNICFTTTDSYDRYTRIDNVRPNNNLRKLYFKEIELGGDEVDLYESEKKYKIIDALREAGAWIGKEK